MPWLKKPQKQYKKSIPDEDRNDIYRSSKWKKLRQSKLMESPLCEICLARGIIKPAVDVHHKDSFTNYTGSQRLWKAYDSSNLLALCKECHAFLHRFGTTHGFDMEQTIKDLDKDKEDKDCPMV